MQQEKIHDQCRTGPVFHVHPGSSMSTSSLLNVNHHTSSVIASAISTMSTTMTAPMVICNQTPSAPTSMAPASASMQAPAPSSSARLRFYVELKPGETTTVSWKKLLKEHNQSQTPSWANPASFLPPAGAHPALASRIAPESIAEKDPLPAPANRFNSVIGRIERLYQGAPSDDEMEDPHPDEQYHHHHNRLVDDDKYDTRDSFIDDTELDDYFSVDDAKLKHSGFFINRGKLEQEKIPYGSASASNADSSKNKKDVKKFSKNEDILKQGKPGFRLKSVARKVITPLSALTSSTVGIKKQRKKTEKSLLSSMEKGSTDVVAKSNEACEKDIAVSNGNSNDGNHLPPESEALLEQSNSGNIVQQHTGDNDGSLLPTENNVAQQKEVTVEVKTPPKPQKDEILKDTSNKKEANLGRAKGTVLERAFLELEKGVAECCPPSLVVREPEQGKRNRLPRDVKQKLAKVARLAAKQGRITDELIERLMGILGHIVRLKTLKMNIKKMVEMGLTAMQEKESRLQSIKDEVMEMIRARVQKLQMQDTDAKAPGSDSQTANREGYVWDHEMEDKICDLYDQYVEGMDEDKGPHLRKLYSEIAELWPSGWMDNVDIKHAVFRAKERRKMQLKASNSLETKKRRRSAIKTKVEIVTTDQMESSSQSQSQQLDIKPIIYNEQDNRTSCLGNGDDSSEDPRHSQKPINFVDESPSPSRKRMKKDVDKTNMAPSECRLVSPYIPSTDVPNWNMIVTPTSQPLAE